MEPHLARQPGFLACPLRPRARPFRHGRLAGRPIVGSAAAQGPPLPGAHNNLGLVLRQTGRTAEAISQFEAALRVQPDYAEAHYNLGLVLRQTGRTAEAVAGFEAALQADPTYAEAHNYPRARLARDRTRCGGRDPVQRGGAGSTRLCRGAQPSLEARPARGAGRIAEAMAQYRGGDPPQSRLCRGAQQPGHRPGPRPGGPPRRSSNTGEAIRLDPNYARAHDNLGIALETPDRPPRAIAQFEEAAGCRRVPAPSP